MRLRVGLESMEKAVLCLMKVQPKFVSCPDSIIVISLTVLLVMVLRDFSPLQSFEALVSNM